MIVLLTDFGASEYVGIMKGVILGVNTGAVIVDLCHDISPQCVIEASWVLKNSYEYFPKDTTFCCVIDPGVGSERQALAVKTQHYHFVAPDNGLLWETLGGQGGVTIRRLEIPQRASRTFHGRDVFAPAAAQIDLGRFDELGERIDRIQPLELLRDGRRGIVVRVDRFGNVITNLPPLDKDRYDVRSAGDEYTMSFYPTYDAAPEDELFIITGSSNTLEISLKNAAASERLHLAPGRPLVIA